ncbi:MAG: DUF3575 domain-containing protein [Flavobacteriales bacterium]|nr:DUF3575 domain-containing protein [Flavobacteriales bacterium]
MKKTSILIFFLLFSTSLFSQSFRVPKNVISTSLYQPFAPEGGYTISYERMLDPGYSYNAAQFSYKMNFTLISSSDRGRVGQDSTQVFYDSDAYQYSGYLILPEFKYYFTWDAPMGIYINVYGSYSDYTKTYSDVRIGDVATYEKNFSKIGRGIGAGFQFKIFNDFCLDIVGGYHLQNVSSETKRFGSDEFLENPKETDEKLYLNLHFGINF